MQNRIYFLLPDVKTTETVVNELLEARVPEDQMYVVARQDAYTQNLPEASVTQTSDVLGSAARGAAAGGVTGVLAGLTALAFPPMGIAVGGGLVAATGLAGTGFGAWAASMIGIRHESVEVEEYEQAIEKGKVLMMVDADPERIPAIEQIVRKQHPEVEIRDTQTDEANKD